MAARAAAARSRARRRPASAFLAWPRGRGRGSGRAERRRAAAAAAGAARRPALATIRAAAASNAARRVARGDRGGVRLGGAAASAAAGARRKGRAIERRTLPHHSPLTHRILLELKCVDRKELSREGAGRERPYFPTPCAVAVGPGPCPRGPRGRGPARPPPPRVGSTWRACPINAAGGGWGRVAPRAPLAARPSPSPAARGAGEAPLAPGHAPGARECVARGGDAPRVEGRRGKGSEYAAASARGSPSLPLAKRT